MEDAVSVHVVDGLAQLVHVQLDPLFRQIGLAVCSHKGESKLSAEGGRGGEGRRGVHRVSKHVHTRAKFKYFSFVYILQQILDPSKVYTRVWIFFTKPPTILQSGDIEGQVVHPAQLPLISS